LFVIITHSNIRLTEFVHIGDLPILLLGIYGFAMNAWCFSICYDCYKYLKDAQRSPDRNTGNYCGITSVATCAQIFAMM
ncbi:hypothetical protein PMAYCL1PPCAC_11600, partial [Pristionchus mayeri]